MRSGQQNASSYRAASKDYMSESKPLPCNGANNHNEQIQFMQDMAQHRQESNDTDRVKSELGDAPEVTTCQHSE